MYIEQFLQTFTNDALGGLERFTEDGLLCYDSSLRCLLSRHQDGYDRSRRFVPSAPMAEQEFRMLGIGDFERRANLRPLIKSEWARRTPPPAPAPVTVKEEELVLA
jgi:hypothetical protein